MRFSTSSALVGALPLTAAFPFQLMEKFQNDPEMQARASNLMLGKRQAGVLMPPLAFSRLSQHSMLRSSLSMLVRVVAKSGRHQVRKRAECVRQSRLFTTRRLRHRPRVHRHHHGGCRYGCRPFWLGGKVPDVSTTDISDSRSGPRLPTGHNISASGRCYEEVRDYIRGVSLHTMTVYFGNKHHSVEAANANKHEWTFFVRSSNPEMIEEVRIELHPSLEPTTRHP